MFNPVKRINSCWVLDIFLKGRDARLLQMARLQVVGFFSRDSFHQAVADGVGRRVSWCQPPRAAIGLTPARSQHVDPSRHPSLCLGELVNVASGDAAESALSHVHARKAGEPLHPPHSWPSLSLKPSQGCLAASTYTGYMTSETCTNPPTIAFHQALHTIFDSLGS
eukprot:697238-Amphidinium_carterae.3